MRGGESEGRGEERGGESEGRRRGKEVGGECGEKGEGLSFQHYAHKVRAMVILPSQELGAQVCRVFEQVAQGTRVRVGMVCGHLSVERECEILIDSSSYPPSSRVDVVIATPGRLVDHLHRLSFATLLYLRFLVLDEADKLLSHQFQQWTTKLWHAVSQDRQQGHHAEPSLEEALRGLCTSTALLQTLHTSPINQSQVRDLLSQLIPGPFCTSLTPLFVCLFVCLFVFICVLFCHHSLPSQMRFVISIDPRPVLYITCTIVCLFVYLFLFVFYSVITPSPPR